MKPKPLQHAHTQNTKYGMGDYYGTGIKAKIGTIREDSMMPNMTNKQMGNPPKSLA